MAGREPLNGGSVCDRAREWASLRIDGELSLLEEELLERHLDACEACCVFEEGMRATTELVRAAPVERPSRRVAVRAGRRAAFSVERRRTALVAAAALAVGALVGSFFESPSGTQPAAPPSQVSLLSRDVNQLRELPREAPPAFPAPAPATPPNPPEGVI